MGGLTNHVMTVSHLHAVINNLSQSYPVTGRICITWQFVNRILHVQSTVIINCEKGGPVQTFSLPSSSAQNKKKNSFCPSSNGCSELIFMFCKALKLVEWDKLSAK